MSEATLDARLMERLKAIARRENRPINALVEDMLTQYDPPSGNSNWAREMARMADEDESGNLDNLSPNLSSQSRKILKEEFAEYLLKRSQDKDDHE